MSIEYCILNIQINIAIQKTKSQTPKYSHCDFDILNNISNYKEKYLKRFKAELVIF